MMNRFKARSRTIIVCVLALAMLFSTMLFGAASVEVYANTPPPVAFQEIVSMPMVLTPHDRDITLTESMRRIVVSLTWSVVANEYRIELFRVMPEGGLVHAGPIHTLIPRMGTCQSFVFNGPFEPGVYRVRVTMMRLNRPDITSFTLGINPTNNLVTNFANDNFHQFVPVGFNLSTTDQNVTVVNRSSPSSPTLTWWVHTDHLQVRQSRLTGEIYFVLIRNGAQRGFRTRAEADAEALFIQRDSNWWRRFGTNQVISHIETRPLR